MSILTFLFFTSVLYFAASDPVPHGTSPTTLSKTASKTATTTASKTPPTTPLTTESKQECVDKFMSAIVTAYQTEFTPVVAGLPEDEQAYLETMMFDGVGSYLNWILSVIDQISDPTANSEVSDDDLIISWQDLGSFRPAVAYQQPSPACPKEQATVTPPK